MSDKKANGISLKIRESNKQRGKDILNTLIECYNEDAVLNKNLKAQNMLSFIDERLITVEEELHEAERIVERYKRENDLSDIDAEAKIILSNSNLLYSLIASAAPRSGKPVLTGTKEYLFSGLLRMNYILS